VQTMVDSRSVVPVEACIKSSGYDTSQFLPTGLGAYATQGVQWSIPFNISNPVLFYNRKTFVAAGLDPDKPPVSLDEMRADSDAIVKSGAATYGLALDSGFDSGGGWYIEQWFAKAGEFYADNQNGRAARATKVLYDNPTGISLLTLLQSMINDGLAVNVGDNSTSGFDNLLKLADKDAPAAMTIATSASIGPVLAVLNGGQFPQIGTEDVGVAAMPGPEGKPGALVGGASSQVLVAKQVAFPTPMLLRTELLSGSADAVVPSLVGLLLWGLGLVLLGVGIRELRAHRLGRAALTETA